MTTRQFVVILSIWLSRNIFALFSLRYSIFLNGNIFNKLFTIYLIRVITCLSVLYKGNGGGGLFLSVKISSCIVQGVGGHSCIIFLAASFPERYTGIIGKGVFFFSVHYCVSLYGTMY